MYNISNLHWAAVMPGSFFFLPQSFMCSHSYSINRAYF